MNYKDILSELESSGRFSAAHELRESMRDHNTYEHDSVRSRHDAGDGTQFSSYARSEAEKAYDRLNRED